ncbi:MAG: hypothetical protein ACFB02_12845 [Mastigocoleus sp.]
MNIFRGIILAASGLTISITSLISFTFILFVLNASRQSQPWQGILEYVFLLFFGSSLLFWGLTLIYSELRYPELRNPKVVRRL